MSGSGVACVPRRLTTKATLGTLQYEGGGPVSQLVRCGLHIGSVARATMREGSATNLSAPLP